MNLATRLAEIAVQSRLPAAHMHGLRLQIMADAAAAICLLIVDAALSVFKPKGLTMYVHRKLHKEHMSAAAPARELEAASAPRWVKVFSISAFVLIVLFRVVLVHLSGGFGHHGH